MGGVELAGRVDETAQPTALTPAAPSSELVTQEALATFNERFLRLLERRTAIYTMGDSTSVPTHVAADLLLSVCFVLGIDPESGDVPEHLLGADLEQEFDRGIADIERRMLATEELLAHVRETMPPIDNVALRDTLKELGEFFRRYDYRSMAHEIPIMIDYPLSPPVDESLKGIAYVEEYVRRLAAEADYLAQFGAEEIAKALAAISFDPVEDLINVGEAVAAVRSGRAPLVDRPVLATEDENFSE